MAVGGNITEDAFGVVAMVAMTPLIAIQILGLVYKIKQSKAKATDIAQPNVTEDGQFTIDFNAVEGEAVGEDGADDDIIDF